MYNLVWSVLRMQSSRYIWTTTHTYTIKQNRNKTTTVEEKASDEVQHHFMVNSQQNNKEKKKNYLQTDQK